MSETLLARLEEQRLLLEAISKGEYCCLRHGLPYVTPSILASQTLCERKAIHELLSSPRKPVSNEAKELVKIILNTKKKLPRMLPEYFSLDAPLATIIQGVPVIGRPHSIVFVKGFVQAIVIGKKTSRPERLYLSDRVKLYAYGLLASRAGLPLGSRTRLVLVAARDNQHLIEAIKSAHQWLRAGASLPPRSRSYTVHFLVHDEGVEEEALAPLLAYWRGDREEYVEPGPWCRSCPLRDSCSATRHRAGELYYQ